MASVSVLIVNYNGASIIEACIDSILKSKLKDSLEIIVVDNQSTDKSLTLLENYKDKIKIIKNKHNSGFSMGNNIAARFATSDYLFLLNNDTVVYEDCIQKLVDYSESNPEAGAVMPRLLNEDLSIQCPGSILYRKIFLNNETKAISFMPGAAVMIKRSLYTKINGLDPNYLFYNDDIDFSKTIKNNKLKLIYFPEATLIHYGGISTTFRKLPSLCEGYRGGIYYVHKHYGRIACFIYRCLLLIDIIPRSFFHFAKSIYSQEDRQYLKLYFKILAIMITKNIFIHHPDLDIEELS